MLAERVEGLIAAAEDAARAIRAEAQAELDEATRTKAEARAEADRIVADARREARSLVERATRVLRQLDSAAPQRQPGPASLGAVEEARLMALQMAMAGRTRGEVESDLRHGLGLDDPDSVLDDVFGQGTPGDQRISWSRLVKGEAL